MKMLIFDMDGVIYDSEPLHQKARIMISEENGIYLSDDDLPNPVGKSSAEFWRLIFQAANKTGLDSEEFARRQFRLVGELALEEGVGCNPGLIKLFNYCKDNDILIALASSSNRQLVDYVLNGLNIAQYFSYTVSGDEVEYVKPASDIYDKVVELSGFDKSECKAIEDSKAGISSAKKAGIYCIGYNNPTSKGQDISIADVVVDHLEDVINLLN